MSLDLALMLFLATGILISFFIAFWSFPGGKNNPKQWRNVALWIAASVTIVAVANSPLRDYIKPRPNLPLERLAKCICTKHDLWLTKTGANAKNAGTWADYIEMECGPDHFPYHQHMLPVVLRRHAETYRLGGGECYDFQNLGKPNF